MDEFKVGDCVWHNRKNYLAIIVRMVDNASKDIFVKLLTDYDKYTKAGFELGTNQSKVTKDRLGQLIYG